MNFQLQTSCQLFTTMCAAKLVALLCFAPKWQTWIVINQVWHYSRYWLPYRYFWLKECLLREEILQEFYVCKVFQSHMSRTNLDPSSESMSCQFLKPIINCLHDSGSYSRFFNTRRNFILWFNWHLPQMLINVVSVLHSSFAFAKPWWVMAVGVQSKLGIALLIAFSNLFVPTCTSVLCLQHWGE